MGDDLEIWFERGVTDGLPVIPPTRQRVDAMLAATSRDRHEQVALVPPNYGRASETIRRPIRDLAPGPDGAETGRLKNLLEGRAPDERVPKFPAADEILIVVAGGTAGRFSAVVPGWMGGRAGLAPNHPPDRRPMKKGHLRRWLGRASLRRGRATSQSALPSQPSIWPFLIGLRRFPATG